MNDRSRRDLLKTMAALPAIPFMKSLSKMLPLQEPAAEPTVTGRLNVIFHGVFVHIFDTQHKDRITAYAPAVDGHVYRAGNWGQEDENPLNNSQPYELQAQFSGTTVKPSLGETTYPVIKCENPIVEANVACRINLPLPHKIVGLRRIHRVLRQPILTGSYAPKVLHYLPLAYAFVYNFDATRERPILTNTYWKAPQRPGPVNLHIRAESPVAHGGGDGYAAIRSVLGYKPEEFDISPTYADCTTGPDLITGVAGILSREEYFLPELTGDSDQLAPGSGQICKPVAHLQPVNCSTTCGILNG